MFASLGTITNSTYKNLKKLKLSKYREALQMMVKKGCINILNDHFRHDDFEKEATLRRSQTSWHRYMNYDDHDQMTNGQSAMAR